jgi:hypothetical protein
MDEEIDDILDKLDRKKGVKSGSKGKRGERNIVKILNNRFGTMLLEKKMGLFSRSVASGARWGQKVVLSQNAMDTYSGDLVVPEGFNFVLESKNGYNDIDLCTVFEKGHKELDAFLKQVNDDSKRCNRKPLLVWKKDRKSPIAFLKTKDIPKRTFDFSLKYKEWTAVSLEELLKADNHFFFNFK